MRFTRILIIAVVFIFLVMSSSMPAHDLWLVPGKFAVKPGETVALFANSGMDFPKSLNSVAPDRVSHSVLLGKAVKEKLTKLSVKDTFSSTKCILKTPGTYVAAISLRAREIKLSAKEFNEYLLHDGLSAIHKLREKKGILDQDAVEYYSKYAKAIIQAGDTPDDTPLKPLGLPIEIVPLTNPYSLKQGDNIKVTVLYLGKPLPNAELGWSFPGIGEGFAGSVKTDDKGIALVPLSKKGAYVIRLTYMEWVKKKTHQWESHWASLTFEVR